MIASIFTTPKPTTSTTSIISTTPNLLVTSSTSSSTSTNSQKTSTTSGAGVSKSSIAENNGHTSLESTPSAAPECTATVTSTIGQPFVPGAGLCAHTVTIVTSIGGVVIQSSTVVQVSTTGQRTESVRTSVTTANLPTTSAGPTSTSSGLPPVVIPGSISFEFSTTVQTSTLLVGTTTIPNHTPVTTPSGVSQPPVQSNSLSNIIATTQISDAGQVTPTHNDPQSTNQVSVVLGSTTSVDTHPTAQSSQTAVIVSIEPQVTSQTLSAILTSTEVQATSQTSLSQPASQSSIETPVSISTQASQTDSHVGTASQATGTPVSISTQASESGTQVGTASQESSNSNTQANSVTGSVITTATQQSSPTQTLASNTSPTNPQSTPSTTPTPTTTSFAPILYGSQTLSRIDSSLYLFGSLTLTPGSAITISGEVISANTNGAIIINAAPPATTSASPAIIVVGGTTITGNGNSDFIIGSQTLTIGGAVTESGQVITLPTPTSTLSPSTLAKSTDGTNTLVTKTLSLGQQGQITSVVIGGQTLTAGGKVTVGGDVLSLASTGGASGIVVVSTVTVQGAGPTASKKGSASAMRVSRFWIWSQVLGVFGMVIWGVL